ncbi:MAG: sarcosine oxidase subunit beta, partial [Alphaproteobacteria bacterium]
MSRFSLYALLRNALGDNQSWPQQWMKPDPKPEYDVVIVGAGGHGLA